MPGKNSWTYKELKDAIVRDEVLEGTDTKPIDLILRLYQRMEEKLNNLT